MSCCTEWPAEKGLKLHDFHARKLLVPGWAGELLDIELAYIQRWLLKDRRLAYGWGFAPSQGTRPADAIRRVVADGDPNDRTHNMRLARPRTRARPMKSRAVRPVGRPNSNLKDPKGETGRKAPVGR